MNLSTQFEVISHDRLLQHFQGHRDLTRRVIEAFPEKEFFEFSIGGMRTAAQLANELLSIAAPAFEGILANDTNPHNEEQLFTTKEQCLRLWDVAGKRIDKAWPKFAELDLTQTVNLFGQYNFPIIQNILYIIDNEIHHRGQMYVYLRAIGVEPPFFWDR